MKEKVVIICPGRGSYTQESLGYLKGSPIAQKKYLPDWDARMRAQGKPGISDLDGAAQFSPKLHLPGENASALIYACAYADFLSIDSARYEVAAVIGNSMGWYITLAVAQALEEVRAFHLVDTMGSMMKERLIGGQIIYSVVSDEWVIDADRLQVLKEAMATVNAQETLVFLSIDLGGYRVIAGTEAGLSALMKLLPKVDIYPFKLMGHGAFHTPLLAEISAKAKTLIKQNDFQAPQVPMIDGRGKIWGKHTTSVGDLYDYTLSHQVLAPYDFTLSLSVALKEFAPDKLILLGPGSTLGGAIGQTLIKEKWLGIKHKKDFIERQKKDPYLLAMGMKEQRELVV